MTIHNPLNIPKHLKTQLSVFLNDPAFFLGFILLLLKSVFIISLINSNGAVNLSISYFMKYNPFLPVFCAFLFALLSFGFFFNGKIRLWFYILIDLILSLLFICDLWNFRGYSNFLSFQLLSETANLNGLSASIFSMARPVDLLFLCDFFLFIPLYIFRRKILPFLRFQRSIPVFLVLFCLSVGYLIHIHYVWDIASSEKNRRFIYPYWDPMETISAQSPFGFHIIDFYNVVLRKQKLELTQKQRDEIRVWFEDQQEIFSDNGYRGLFKNKNLILIQMESFENFIINRKINGQEISPVLNSLLSESLYFTAIYEQIYNGTSSDSDLMVNTSVYPVRSGSTFFRFPNTTYHSLPQLFRKAGYKETIAIHPDPGSYWNWMKGLSGIGFDHCMDAAAFTKDDIIGLGLSDRSFFRQIGPVLRKLQEPFYAFMISLTSHGPFDLPEKFQSLTLPKNLTGTKLGGYFQCQHYTDQSLGNLLHTLASNGLLKNSVLVFYGDHAGIHKYYNDELADIAQPREDWWMNPERKIPLIIYCPGMKGKEFHVRGGHIDIMPTLCYLMGIDNRELYASAMGRNLLTTKRDFTILGDGTYIGTHYSTNFSAHVVHGLAIADMIISGNYFKKR